MASTIVRRRRTLRVWLANHAHALGDRLDPTPRPTARIQPDGSAIVELGGVPLARVTSGQLITQRSAVTTRRTR